MRFGFVRKIRKLFGRTERERKTDTQTDRKSLGNIHFNDILDEIIDELLSVRGEGDERIGTRARELEEEYSRKTGFNIKVEADRDGATVWINDLQFDYEFVEELPGEPGELGDEIGDDTGDTGGRGERARRGIGSDDLAYIR